MKLAVIFAIIGVFLLFLSFFNEKGIVFITITLILGLILCILAQIYI